MLIILAVLFSCITILSAQSLDSLGNNDNAVLNKHEAVLLDSFSKENRGDFSFQYKKIAFVTGSSGNVVLTKSQYFERNVQPWISKGLTPQTFLIKFSSLEKISSGGYDGLILSWVKIFTDKRRRSIISKLGR